MLRHTKTIMIALFAALLILVGGIGTFTAEAANFKATINEARADGPYAPLEAYEQSPDATDIILMPGLPY